MFSKTTFFRGETYSLPQAELELFQYLGYKGGDPKVFESEDQRDEVFFDLGAQKYGEGFRKDSFTWRHYSSDDYPYFGPTWGTDKFHRPGEPIPELEDSSNGH